LSGKLAKADGAVAGIVLIGNSLSGDESHSLKTSTNHSLNFVQLVRLEAVTGCQCDWIQPELRLVSETPDPLCEEIVNHLAVDVG
jgi:hypothetical protein